MVRSAGASVFLCRAEDAVARPGLAAKMFAREHFGWCGQRDLNPHDFRHWNLNPARLPVPPCPLRGPRSAPLYQVLLGVTSRSRRFARLSGRIAGKSSAIRPEPNRLAASPCSQTAAQAASKAGMPWARRPPISPDSTSPDPAVARLGGALVLMAALPSGAAITVSAPFSTSTAWAR